jgi:hypothetical protein
VIDAIFSAAERYEGEWVQAGADSVSLVHRAVAHSGPVSGDLRVACGRLLRCVVLADPEDAVDGCKRCVRGAVLRPGARR